MSRQYTTRAMPIVKVTHDDLKRMGIVRSRYDQHQKIKSGKLRPPNKSGDTMQSGAWWWWSDVCEDLEDEKNSAVSRKLEATAEIQQLATTVGTDGKARPSARSAPGFDAVATVAPKPIGRRLMIHDRALPPINKLPVLGNAMRLDEIVGAIDRLVCGGLEVKPKDVLASLGDETKRRNMLGSAQRAHGWLSELLETPEIDPGPVGSMRTVALPPKHSKRKETGNV